MYKGLAISGDRLYATDFHNGRVDVYDAGFHRIGTPGAFVDRRLPRRFAPFGIQSIGGRVFVAFAKQDAKREDDVEGRGLGFVDAFDRNGRLLARVAQRGDLNAPWGIVRAPAGFGRFSGDLLIGNFGDDRINASRQRSARTFTHDGELRIGDGKRLVIDGLWALQFGHGAANNGPANTLFFTGGPDDGGARPVRDDHGGVTRCRTGAGAGWRARSGPGHPPGKESTPVGVGLRMRGNAISNKEVDE